MVALLEQEAIDSCASNTREKTNVDEQLPDQEQLEHVSNHNHNSRKEG